MRWIVPLSDTEPEFPILKASYTAAPKWQNDTIYEVYRNGKWKQVRGDELRKSEKSKWWNVYDRSRLQMYETIEDLKNKIQGFWQGGGGRRPGPEVGSQTMRRTRFLQNPFGKQHGKQNGKQ